MSKLPKKLIPYAETLDLYNQEHLIKVDFDVPTTFKVFSKAFNYTKLLKKGLPTLGDIHEYFGYVEIKNDHVFIPDYYYKKWLSLDLNIKTLKLELKDKSSRDKLLFVELGTHEEIFDTFVFFNPGLGLERAFECAFENLYKAKEKEQEIKQILNLD